MRSLIGKISLSMMLYIWTLSNNPAHARKPLTNEYQKLTPVLEQVNLRRLQDKLGFQKFINRQLTLLNKIEKELPDKIIASKKVRGRFIKTISGDYFYAQVSTKYGGKTFLIDGNEGCFLRKHFNEQLSITYDVLDRYTPQANGYRQVNIIRNITTRKTSLKKWRMTLAKNKLGQCYN
jgi:hypothetical protein